MAGPGVGVTLIVAGLSLIALRKPLAVIQVRSQPRWMHPWKGAVSLSRTIIALIGAGLVVAGILEAGPYR